MAITGGQKYFERSKNLFADGASITISSGDAAGERALDKNKITYWRSVGSSDSITETMEIQFPASAAIDRLLLLDFNWKEFTAQYHNGSTFVDFTSVVGLDGALGGGISETTFADDSAYYEFDEVTTDRIQITVTKTKVADEEKYLNQVIATKELGTLEGFPIIKRVTHSRNSRRRKVLSGRMLIQKSEPLIKRVEVDFKNYPNRLSDDIDLIFTLFDSEEPFLIWLCGGRRGSDHFGKQLEGYRLRDVYDVQIENDITATYSKNVFKHTVNLKMRLAEHV